jgi:hypothetical protein
MLSKLRKEDELGWNCKFKNEMPKPEKPDSVELYETINAAIGMSVGELYKRRKSVLEYNKMIDPYTETQFQFIFEVGEEDEPILCKFALDLKSLSSDSYKIGSNYDTYVSNMQEYAGTFGVKTYNPYEQLVNE